MDLCKSSGVKRKAIQSNQAGPAGKPVAETRNSCTEDHAPQFMPVRDSRNRRIATPPNRGALDAQRTILWCAVGRPWERHQMHAHFPLLDEDGAPIRTLTPSKDAFDALKNSRRENALPQPGHKPSFDTFAAEYLAMAVTQKKKPGIHPASPS